MRSLRPLLVTSALGAGGLLLVSCGGSGGSGGGASTAAPVTSSVAPVPSSSVPVAGPRLVGARWADTDGSRSVTAGDEVTLTFDRSVRLGPADASRDLAVGAGDTLGAGATLRAGGKAEEVVVVLGAGPGLSLWRTYLPGQAPGAGASPALVALAAGRVADALVGATGDPAVDGRAVPVVVADPDAAPFDSGRRFVDPPLATARAVYGNLHAHTGFSDGQLDPAAAHAHVKGLPAGHGLDFMATSDHLEQLTAPTWSATQNMADAAQVAGSYVTLRGYEWGHGYILPLGWYNHINIIGSPYLPALGATMTPSDLYAEVLARGFSDGAIGIFNHPYIHKPPLVYDQWDDFRHDAAADKLMSLIDCEGKGSEQSPDLGFLPALAKGWRVAPSSNQDNHSPNWGDKDDQRTGLWLVDLDRPSIIRAVREGRAFSTSDRNAKVRLIADGALWMGSTVAGPGRVALRVEADDADGEPFARIDLVSNGVVVASQPIGGGGPVVFETTLDPQVDAYVFARVYQADGDELFSAPIYVDR